MSTRGTFIVLLLSATLAVAPSAAATVSVDADPQDGEFGVTIDDPEEENGCRPNCLPLSSGNPADLLPGDDPEEEEEHHCDPHCLPTSSDGTTATIAMPAGDAEVTVHAVELDDESQLLPEDPEEENGCRPSCLPVSIEDGEVTVATSVAEATIVVEPVALAGDTPIDHLLPGDDPEEENGCRPNC